MTILLAHEAPFSLGSLRFRPAIHEAIHADGRRVLLEPRVMQVLIALVRADGGMVTRDELNASCWQGRIVGEDAINRVISRLRSVAADAGGDAFQIETLKGVGYRLVRGDGDANEKAPSAISPAARLASTPAGLSWLRAHPRSLTAAMIVALLIGIGIWWTSLRPGIEPSQKAIAQLLVPIFAPLSTDVPPATAAALKEEIVSAFGQTGNVDIVTDAAHLAASPLAWRLSGTIARAGPNLRFVVHLSHQSTGKIVWSAALERPAADPSSALKSVAAAIEEVVNESLIDAANYNGGALPDSVTALMIQFNQDTTMPTGPYNHAEVEMRRAVAQAPDFAAGWSTLALTLGYAATASDDPAAIANARAEAPIVIATALRLHPGDAQALLAAAKIVPPSDFGGRDAAFVRATSAPTSTFGAEHSGYSVFLLNVGRIEEAVREAKFTYDLDPIASIYMTRYARALIQNGQYPLAAKILDQTMIFWPGDISALDLLARSALSIGAYDRGAAATRADPRLTSAMRAAMLATFAALRSGDPAAKKKAAIILLRLSEDSASQSPFLVSALAALGHDADATAAAGRLIAAKNAMAAEVLFDPILASARRTPPFAALVTRLGLVDYWRKSGRPPDFCAAPDAPSLCVGLRRKSPGV